MSRHIASYPRVRVLSPGPAYTIRFLAIAVGQIEASLGKVSLSLDMAARTLGHNAGSTLVRYHIPLIRGSMLTALMIVFVDCMKELPAIFITLRQMRC